jgi:hypothetical protein
MWDFFVKENYQNSKINMEDSFYCGDAGITLVL